jgi:hypothetical protein
MWQKQNGIRGFALKQLAKPWLCAGLPLGQGGSI